MDMRLSSGLALKAIGNLVRKRITSKVEEGVAARLILNHVEIPITELQSARTLMEAGQLASNPAPYGIFKLTIARGRGFKSSDNFNVETYSSGQFYATQKVSGSQPVWDEKTKFVLYGIPEDLNDATVRLVLKNGDTPVGTGSVSVSALVNGAQWIAISDKQESLGEVEMRGCISPITQDINAVSNAIASFVRVKLRSIEYPVGKNPAKGEVKLTITFTDGQSSPQVEEFTSAAAGACFPIGNKNIKCKVALERSFLYRIEGSVKEYRLDVTLQVDGQEIATFSNNLDQFLGEGQLWHSVSKGDPLLSMAFDLYIQSSQDCGAPQRLPTAFACGRGIHSAVTATSVILFLVFLLVIMGCCFVCFFVGSKWTPSTTRYSSPPVSSSARDDIGRQGA